MFKFSKESLIDWQVLKDGRAFAWITKHSGPRKYTVTFRHLEGEFSGFRTLTEAKRFAAL